MYLMHLPVTDINHINSMRMMRISKISTNLMTFINKDSELMRF